MSQDLLWFPSRFSLMDSRKCGYWEPMPNMFRKFKNAPVTCPIIMQHFCYLFRAPASFGLHRDLCLWPAFSQNALRGSPCDPEEFEKSPANTVKLLKNNQAFWFRKKKTLSKHVWSVSPVSLAFVDTEMADTGSVDTGDAYTYLSLNKPHWT